MKTEKEVLNELKRHIKLEPNKLVMLGSGWNEVIKHVIVDVELSYKDIFGSEAGVPGHEGKLVIGKMGKESVAFMAGRFHLYEGYSAKDATLPIRVMKEIGVEEVIITSASGGLNEDYRVGDFVILSDLITLFLPSNPLIGAKFQDMSNVFDGDLRDVAIRICEAESIPYKEGIYMYVPGPHYETPADKRMAMSLGADCIGMSTVPETIQAKNLGMKVLGLSYVTNLAFVKHDHKEVVEAANRGSERMVKVLKAVITRE